VVLFSVVPLLVVLFGVVLLADGGGGAVIVLFTGELVFELLKGGMLDGWGVVVVFPAPCFDIKVVIGSIISGVYIRASKINKHTITYLFKWLIICRSFFQI
jgi:hypothetical protein